MSEIRQSSFIRHKAYERVEFDALRESRGSEHSSEKGDWWWRGDEDITLIDSGCKEPWTTVTMIITPIVGSDAWQSVHTRPAGHRNEIENRSYWDTRDIEAKGANYFLHWTDTKRHWKLTKITYYLFFKPFSIKCHFPMLLLICSSFRWTWIVLQKVQIVNSRSQILFTFIFLFLFSSLKKQNRHSLIHWVYRHEMGKVILALHE